ncbi:PI-PLC X domain-containing protein [Lachnellula subtilissima]|uniref:PI-PLC X domain-containing protein n=1 Tax=Lachnellula subtilissima TaxID=602034 RepID=A0A8H8RR25_9HELO|nr:PI-PLC X domain-containing protein [Lachnellula subtilissima]
MLFSFKLLAASASLLSLSQASPQGGFFSQSSAVAVASSTTKVSASAVSLAAAATGTTACNNSPDLCNRNYNNITHMGAHDSAFLRDSSTGFTESGNQYYNATVALSAGIRLLQAQVHLNNGVLELCHTSCALLDGGSLATFLTAIKTWMDANPNEVVTLLLVNSDDQTAATFGSVFNSTGISTYGYTPSSTDGPVATWPTLQTLITANTRLVTFIASITYDSSYPSLLPEFSFVFETAYGQTFPDFNCTIDRPSGLASSTAAISAGYMGLVNHFADTNTLISTPDLTNLPTTNSPATNTSGSLGTEGQQCTSEWAKKPTFILVDYFNVGPAVETADNLNGITAVGRTSVSTAELTQSSGAGIGKGVSWTALLGIGAVAVVNVVVL